MTSLETLKAFKTVLIVTGIAFTMACGYSHSMTPPTAGSMPTISTMSPNSEVHNTGGFTLTVNGSNFNSNAVVNFNGAAMNTSWTNAGQVKGTIPDSAIMNTGMVQVTVTNPAVQGTGPYGGGGMTAETSAPATFTID